MDREFIKQAAMYNLACDEMDAVFGMPTSSGRLPVAQMVRAMNGTAVLNNIHLTNSNVGVLNTGHHAVIRDIDAAITLSKDTDVELIGAHLQKLTQAIIDAATIDAGQKGELLDLIQSLAEQVVGARKPSVIRTLISAIEQRLNGAASLVTIVQGLSAALRNLLGG